jgi:DNA invertase Pin-like site-specific DNA recombinase
MNARYIRISKANQKLEAQLIKKHSEEILFIDAVSGSIPFMDRPQGKKLMNQIENGVITYISVHSIDTLGRNLFDILSTLEILNAKLVTLKVDNLEIESLVGDQLNHIYKLIISVLADIAVMERESLLESQREGIARAKAKGAYKGRVKGSTESDEEVLERYKSVIKRLKQGNTLRDIAGSCKVSLGTVQKVKAILNKTDS